MEDIESVTPFTNYKKKERIQKVQDVTLGKRWERIDIKKTLSIEFYDFPALETNIPHNKLRNLMIELIAFSFKIGEKQFIFLTKLDATWTKR